MLLIEHRVNSLDHLQQVPVERGIEVDVRDYQGQLVLAHDPFESGPALETLLAAYQHAFVIFNLKCDGLARQVIELAARHQIEDYFLLDLANPTLINLARQGERRLAVRYSEFEPIEFALAFAGQIDWVWIDCFSRLPLDAESYQRLREHFKICLVSPELQNHSRQMIQEFRYQLRATPLDAVCTDFCDDWA